MLILRQRNAKNAATTLCLHSHGFLSVKIVTRLTSKAIFRLQLTDDVEGFQRQKTPQDEEGNCQTESGQIEEENS
jgi:hypothetical protein